MTKAKPLRQSVFYFVHDYWACGWYRCYTPGTALQHLGYTVYLDENISDQAVDECDVVVVQQPSGEQQLGAIRRANAAGKLSVVEMDDDVWNLAPTNPGAEYWHRPDVKFHARACVEEAQLVTTPTHVLAEKLRTMNRNVKMLPNMLPTEGWDYPEPKMQREDRVVIGWAGSKSHGGDFGVIDGVMQQLLDRYPHVEFVVAGGPPIIDMVAHDRMSCMKATDIQNYPTLLENFDVGVIPLADNAFNRAKSDLKFVEYSMLGIPSVATKLDPYMNTIKHGENGFLAKSPKDWLKHLTRLIEDIELRRTIGAAAQKYARTRTIDHGIQKWERAYGLTRPDSTDESETTSEAG